MNERIQEALSEVEQAREDLARNDNPELEAYLQRNLRNARRWFVEVSSHCVVSSN